ncbi:uncharacterized protein TNCV_4522291 [Trichonephila clavipes]|nr:uncharacterized protein TNCV_4522291 [Trichonephila clavipes]
MGDFTFVEKADMHYMHGHANGNDRAALQIYYAQFSDRRMPDHRFFQRLYRQHRETRSFYVTRHDAGRRRAVCIPSLVLNEKNRLHLFHFQRVQVLNPADYLLRLPVDGTAIYAAAGLHVLNSYERLL